MSRRLDDLQHGEFGFSRHHDWTGYTHDPDGAVTQWACETCQRVTARPGDEPDNCLPHDEPQRQEHANVGYAAAKFRR